jgi:hypothetical protein
MFFACAVMEAIRVYSCDGEKALANSAFFFFNLIFRLCAQDIHLVEVLLFLKIMSHQLVKNSLLQLGLPY